MQRDAFKAWLGTRSLSSAGINTRTYAVSRIESVLALMGLPDATLEEAFARDGLTSARHALTEIMLDAKDGGDRFRILMPNSASPANRLMSYRSYLGQYAAFLRAAHSNAKLSAWPELEAMRAEFLRRAPDFVDFSEEDGAYFEQERSYKNAMIEKIDALARSGIEEVALAQQALRALMPSSGPLVQWQTLQTIESSGDIQRDQFHQSLGNLVRAGPEILPALKRLIVEMVSFRDQTGNPLTKGAILNVVLTVAGAADPSISAPFKIEKARELAARLGRPGFGSGPISEAEIDNWLGLLRQIFTVMRDDWQWQPRDLFDVQGFAWAVLDKKWKFPDEDDDMDAPQAAPGAMQVLNTILYGPPGTGKTYRTTRQAVAICDGADEAARLEAAGELKDRYEVLRSAGRIGFVTFHQSYSYEDFVEGLRPEPSESGAGFGLKARPGILRQMADLAAKGRAIPAGESGEDRLAGRAVFKMSLGRSDDIDDGHIFDECIQNGYVLLGWGGEVDWSDPRFDSREEIVKYLELERPDVDQKASRSKYLHAFRNRVRPDDVVIVSRGNLEFRAVGIFEGGYEYVPREEDRFHHRRKVRWLWHDGALPCTQVITGRFTQETIYRINPENLKADALAAYLTTPATAEHLPHVLIIDEINRANISKVFGELITLLEEDKRSGAVHAIRLTLPFSGEEFGLPPNLHLLGTMNTADRSIALLDTALRRRFHFVETPPEPELLPTCDGIDLARLLQHLNARIEYLFDRDHLIGHAFFMSCQTRGDIDEVMRRKVIPLLAEYFHEDWERIIAILGGPAQGFISRDKLPSPPGLEGDGIEERYRYSVRPAFEAEAYLGLQG